MEIPGEDNPEVQEAQPSSSGHAKYDTTMRRRAARVKKQAARHRLFLYFSTIISLVLIVIVVAIDNLIVPMMWPKIIAAGFVIVWIAIYSKWLLPFRISITCPSCDNQVNLNQDWICGWCDDEKNSLVMQTFVGYRVPLESCKQCDETANAVECPHCKEHIVFNVDAYNHEQEFGALKPGVARMV